MNAANNELTTRDTFTVIGRESLDGKMHKILAYLYQPIIGNEAFALYLTLASEIATDTTKKAPSQMHAHLITACNISLTALYKARLRLEGIGLLQTYEGTNEVGNHDYLYELISPLSVERFFQDELLTLLLYEAVGDRRYQQLLTLFATPKVDKQNYRSVTKTFNEVYDFQLEKINQQSALIQSTQEKFPTKQTAKIVLADENFNWDFFMTQLRQRYLPASVMTDELKQDILYFHKAYGYNEMDLVTFVEEAVDQERREVSSKRLKHFVYNDYHKKNPQRVMPQDKEEPVLATPAEKQTYRKNSLLMDGYSQQEIDLVLSCEALTPMEFLEATKEQLGGFVGSDERFAIEGLVKSSRLPNSVVNILIHYLLVIQKKPTINRSSAETIANNWAMEDVRKPEEAIRKVRDFSKQQEQKKVQRNTRTSANRKVESLPDWVDKKVEETEISEDEKAKLEERLRRLREK